MEDHQDPGSAALNILQSVEVLAVDPDERCAAVIQPGGDKSVDQPVSCAGWVWTESGNISEMVFG